MITPQNLRRQMSVLNDPSCPHFKIFWKCICPWQYFVKKALIAFFDICSMILRLKAIIYLNLAVIVCLFLDSPTKLGTKNLVMSAYILRQKKE